MAGNEDPNVVSWKDKAKKFFHIGNHAAEDEDSPAKRLESAKYDDMLSRYEPLKTVLEGIPHSNQPEINALDILKAEAEQLHDDGDNEGAIKKFDEIFKEAKKVAEGAEGTAKEIYEAERKTTDKLIHTVHKKRATRKQANTAEIVDQWHAAEKTAKELIVDDEGVQVRNYVAATKGMIACRALMNEFVGEDDKVVLEEAQEEEGPDPQALLNGLEDFAPPPHLRSQMVIGEARSLAWHKDEGDEITLWKSLGEEEETEAQTELLDALEEQMKEIQRQQEDLSEAISKLREAKTVRRLTRELEKLDPDDDLLAHGVKLREVEDALEALQDAARALAKEELLGDPDEITAAFESLTDEDRFDTFMDARSFKPSKDGEIKPELAAAQAAMERVQKTADQMKAFGASHQDIAELWEAVPQDFRPDEVIEELRPYAMARKAIVDESEASRLESRGRSKRKLGDIALQVAGVVDSIATATLDASLVEQFAETGDVFGEGGSEPADEEALSLEGGKLHEWAVTASVLQAGISATTIGLERRARAIALADDDTERNNPETLLELQRARSGRLKMAEHIRIGREIANSAITIVKVFTVNPVVAGFLTILKGILKLLKALEWNLKRLEAAEKELLLMMTQQETDRTNPASESADAMRAALAQQKLLAERMKKAETIGAAGKMVRGTGTAIAGAGSGEVATMGTGLVVMGIGGTMEGVGVVLTGRAFVANYITNKAEEKKCIALMQDAAAGDREAKKQLMKDSSFYAAMYLALAAKEEDPTAIRILNDMQLSAEDIEQNNAYILRKAMLWASGKDDRSPDEAGIAGIAKEGATRPAKKTKSAMETTKDFVMRRNQTDDRVVVREFDPELTAKNWDDTKKAAYESGVREAKTGIGKQLKALEKAVGKIGDGDMKQVRKAVEACEELFHLFGGLSPEWISPRPDGEMPVGFITYAQDMRELAMEQKLDLLSAYEEDEMQAPRYVIPPAEVTEASFKAACDLAKENKVILDDSVKAAKKAFGAFGKIGKDMPRDEEVFELAAEDPKRLLEMIEISRDLAAAVGNCAPINELSADVDRTFRAYVDQLSQRILEHIVDPLEGIADKGRSAFKPPASRDGDLKFSRHRIKEAYENAKDDCLLQQEMPESMTTALDGLSDALKNKEMELDDDELEGSDAHIKSLDKVAVDLLAFEKEARDWRKDIEDHKPFRDYLLSLAELAREQAEEADRKKAICVKARDEAAGADVDANVPPKPPLTLDAWTRWVTEARAVPDMIDRGTAGQTTQAFKNYEKAPELLPLEELIADVKHARKIFKKRRHALYSLRVLLPKVMKGENKDLERSIRAWRKARRAESRLIDNLEKAVDDHVEQEKQDERDAKEERKRAKRERKAANA